MHKALKLEDFSLRIHGKQVFSDLDMEINRGEIVGICGTNSSHICKLIPLLTRSYPSPSHISGILEIDGVDIARLSDEEMRFFRMMNVAVLPTPSKEELPHISVERYILLPFKEGVNKTAHDILTDAKRIMQLLGVLAPERIFKKKLHTLSETELRAVLYAAALSTDPVIAICNTDSAHGIADPEEFYSVLIKVAKIKNIALLLLTSDIQFARQFAERIFIGKQDRLISLEGSVHPYMYELEAASEMRPIPTAPQEDAVLLTAQRVFARRGEKRLDFSLHSGEILPLSFPNGMAVFSGKKRPFRGKLAFSALPIHKSSVYKKRVMPIYADMPLLPVERKDAALRAYAARPSMRMSIEQVCTGIGLMQEFCEEPMPDGSVYETLRFGLALAAAAEAKVILLSDLEKVPSSADRYELLKLLARVVSHTGAGAIVFSSDPAVYKALGTSLEKESFPAAENTEEERVADNLPV